MKERIVIFGASTAGKICYKYLKERLQIKYFCDNNKSTWGSHINGIEIIPPDCLSKIEKQYDRIIIASCCYEQIREQLSILEIDKPIDIFEIWFNQETMMGSGLRHKKHRAYLNGEEIFLETKCERDEIERDRGSLIYDDIYKTGGSHQIYFKDYSETPYVEMWLKALDLIKNGNHPKIIDIGCGPGQFAQLLFDNKIINYTGIDFSDEAINMAKIRNKKYRNQFRVEDAFKSNIFAGDYDIAIFFEILEHIREDLQLLARVKSNTKIIFSVPNFPDKTHVRHFVGDEHVRSRYCKSIKIDGIYTFKIGKYSKLFLVEGTKK